MYSLLQRRLVSRRALRHGATVALITDGLDRDAGYGLAKEMERKNRSRLICFGSPCCVDGYEPRARGMQAILPYVDELSSVHNLESLEQHLSIGGVMKCYLPTADTRRKYDRCDASGR